MISENIESCEIMIEAIDESITVKEDPNSVVIALEKALGAGSVKTGADVQNRACSYWDSSPTQAKALVLPKNTQQVSQALKICHQMNQTVVTHGGLTGCVEGAHSHANDIIISLEKMSTIEEIDDIGATAIVQSGVILEDIQHAAEEQNLFFPLDLGARGSCTIGGNIATNAGGINVLRYGMTRNLVLGLEVVLIDGTIVSSMNQMLKNNAGYDSKQIFIGSEGTLGIVTRAVLKLFPKPTTSFCALIALNSFANVAAFLNSMSESMGGTLSAFEIMWGDYYQAMTLPDRVAPSLERDFPYYVLLEARGNDIEQDGTRFESSLENALSSDQVLDVVIPSSEAKRQTLWEVREGFEVIMNESLTFLYDVSLPIKEMDEYVNRMKQELAAIWPESKCYVFGHVADGNLHVFVQPWDERNTETAELRRMSDQCVYKHLKQANGSVSAEHGIGTEKKAWLSHSRTEEEIQLMKLFKKSLDPNNLLNPGVIFDI